MLELSKIINAINSFFDSGLFLALQILGGLISAFFIYWIIVLAHRNGNIERQIRDLRTAWNKSHASDYKMVKRWEKISKRAEGDDSREWRAAIFEADFMLGEILKSIGYKGVTAEEKLENILPEQFPSLQEAWRAHRVSDFLMDDPLYPVTREVVEETMRIYKNIFTETGILL